MNSYFTYFIACMLLLFSSCSVTKNFQENESLLVKNKIDILNGKKMANKSQVWDDLIHATSQKPNSKLFGLLPVRLWFFASANKGKDNKFKWWIKNKVGEEPVKFESEQADKTDKLFINYLQNYGYFYAAVSHSYKTTKHKKTTVSYKVNAGPVWTIGNVKFPTSVFKTDSITAEKKANTFLKTGQKFDITKLKAERERIEFDLKNKGYYQFSKDYVSFDLDTTLEAQKVNITIRINQINDTTAHTQFYLNNIYTITDYNVENLTQKINRDTILQNNYYYLSHLHKFSIGILEDAIFFQKGDLFSKTNYLKTVKRFSDLGAFKFVSIDLLKAKNSPTNNLLNCYINLTPQKRNGFSADGQINVNNEGFLGVSGNVTYRNRNLFHHADLFIVDLNSGVSLQFKKTKTANIVTTDYGMNVSYYWNKFLFPFLKKGAYKGANPRTKISVRYNFEKRFGPDADGAYKQFYYDLHNFGASFGYEWTQKSTIRHLLNPVSFSFFIYTKKGIEFINRLDSSISLRKTYQEQIFLGPSYTFIYTNQKSKTDNTFLYLKANVEVAGNLLMAGFSIANMGKNKPLPYTILGKEFSQYFKLEIDFRGFKRLNSKSSLAGRVFTGFAIPYGNSSAIPFLKQFYVGGPNSMRGFRIRQIGPGSYYEPGASTGRFLTQTGDMKIEMNAELRFDIYKWFKGAMFMDVGNIWLLHKADDIPNGEFAFNRFWNEFAINTGAGLRLDFNYFVIRLDYGLPIRNPTIVGANKWKVQNGNFQLAVGYPF